MWHQKTISETLESLETDPKNGLGSNEANKRLELHGKNELTQKAGKSLFRMILDQFNDALIFILLGAALIALLLGEFSDAIIIMAVVVINAVVGVIQENKAEKALDALKKMSSPNAIVKRDGHTLEIPAWQVVPGDVILIEAGRIIPCDLRWIEAVNLEIEEAALTGESVPSSKDANTTLPDENAPLGDRKNLGFMSTVATYGRGIGIATGTGMNTEIGKIATLLETTEAEATPLQKKLEDFGKKLSFIILGLCAFMFGFSVIRQLIVSGGIGNHDLLEFFLTAVSLAVAAIPEGLPAFVTIVLAIGVQKMSKRNAIVRRLPAVETLGSVNVICSDKTGTLTQNKMTVMEFATIRRTAKLTELSPSNSDETRLLEILVLCNDSTKSHAGDTGDPTELALLNAGMAHDLSKPDLELTYQRIGELPFESDRKLMSTIHSNHNDNTKKLVCTKGAAENLLQRSTHILDGATIRPLQPADHIHILSQIAAMSTNALRVLGGAFKELPVSQHVDMDSIEQDLVFAGIVGMIDPPRHEVIGSIANCKVSGIITVMITGDHKDTAFAIASQLGIATSKDQAISGVELDSLDDAELAKKTKTIRVFARVSPEHKVRIVKAFRSTGAIVSMTGDGVNDAPSLKSANIGVAMGITGTDVAKGASDMILTDDNFKTIVHAIEEGRNIYDNIRKSILFLLSCNAGEILAIFTGIMLGLGSPLKPIHILWVNLVTDTLPALALCMDPGDKDVMKRPPRDPGESIFSRGGIRFIFTYGFLKGFITLTAFMLGLSWYGNTGTGLVHAETMAFAVLALCQLFHAFNLRHETKSIVQIGIFSNMYMIGAFAICMLLQLSVMLFPFMMEAFHVVPLNSTDWLLVFGLSISPLVVYELEKLFKRIYLSTKVIA